MRKHFSTAEKTEEEVEGISEETMIKIMLEDFRSTDTRKLVQALKRIKYYLYDGDDKKMAKKTKKVQEAFFQVSGHLALVRLMKEHLHCKSLQISGLQVLTFLTYKNASTQTAVAKVEGIQAILTAMKSFPSDQTVIRYGFGNLVNVVFENKANTNLLVMELGGIPFLVEQMKEFRDDVDVTRYACSMLYYLSVFAQLRNCIVDANAVTALADAIERHRGNLLIQKHAQGNKEFDAVKSLCHQT